MATDKKQTRRRYSEELKARVLVECEAPGSSVAKVAMAHGINANIVHGWRQLVREAKLAQTVAASVQTQFVPVMMNPAAPQPSTEAAPQRIEVELRRGTVTMKLSWPASAAPEFAAWTRELLR
jgi:transposase